MDDAAQTILLPTLVETLRMQAAQVEFKCGDLVGPYALSNDENAIRITLSNFTGEPMTLSIEANDVTRRVQSTPSPLLANCVVLQTGRLLQILFTKDIRSLEALRAILVADMNYRMEQETLENKKYECSNCHTAKFNSLENLKVHNELYCSGKVANEQEENGNGQNVILLPLAYHDFLQENAIKVMGPVHSVIPVAVGRRSTLINTQPMFVRNKTKLDMPPNLSISHSKLSIKIPIIDLDEKIPSASTPLDLSSPSRAQSIPSLSASCSPASKSSGSEPFYPDRPFSCTCGVSFSSQTTFDAHRQLYCSHTTRESTSRLAGSNRSSDVLLRKVPEKCTKCDFMPTSSSQLSMHIRSSHQTTKTFTCLVCGYRAFSMRGVRTHMRSHPTEDAQRFKANDKDS